MKNSARPARYITRRAAALARQAVANPDIFRPTAATYEIARLGATTDQER